MWRTVKGLLIIAFAIYVFDFLNSNIDTIKSIFYSILVAICISVFAGIVAQIYKYYSARKTRSAAAAATMYSNRRRTPPPSHTSPVAKPQRPSAQSSVPKTLATPSSHAKPAPGRYNQAAFHADRTFPRSSPETGDTAIRSMAYPADYHPDAVATTPPPPPPLQLVVTTSFSTKLKDRLPSTETASTSLTPIEATPINLDAIMWAVPDEAAIIHKVRTNGPSYQVNLKNFSCSCQSWLSDRCRYNASDIRRLCKHQVQILEKNNLFTADALMLCLADAVPMRSRPYCIARIKSSDIGCTIIRYQNHPWLDVLVSGERRSLRRYGLNIEEDRWAYGGNFGERPPESKRIKELVHAWLAGPDSARFHEVPDLPEEAAIAKQKFAEEAAIQTTTTRMTEDEAKGRCFICRFKIVPTSSSHERGTKITCPKCGNINYVANSGTLFNPKKIEIWAKYGDNYDDPHSVGLVRQARSHAETRLNGLKADLMSGAITKDDYRTKCADIKSDLSTQLGQLEAKETAEMNIVREQEVNLKKKVANLSNGNGSSRNSQS